MINVNNVHEIIIQNINEKIFQNIISVVTTLKYDDVLIS